MNRPKTHLVLIPAFNPGRLLAGTVEGALSNWPDVWVVVDGSTDASHDGLVALGRSRPGLRVIIRSRNGGKGAAVLTGALEALAGGFTHALVMDADGQHPAERIVDFMEASMASPGALVCGRPVFGPEAPRARLYGRMLSAGLVRLETSGRGAADPLFGFRVYPLDPLVRVLRGTRGGRRYDFDPEVAVRLAWIGTPAVNLAAACSYVDRERGGVSHFRYLRDNMRMIGMHARLICALMLGRRGARA
ncbi:MAG TPA: glycosyltransferase family 2 protein, partial [Candidatus Sulfotelmatobacter sp.]|nr:glycosyltransferase family 2 protein [Candidatus Sulfotelmatobacter sp.]